MKPIISIIVPIYNVEKYLNRCMTSLLNQTIKNIEIILVDDGSPDNCPQLCEQYALLDDRIKVIHKKNEGLGYARNSGLEVAKGEYIAFVDSDDYVSTNMYEELYNAAKTQSFDIVYCGVNAQKSNGKTYQEHVSDRILSSTDDIINFLANIIACDISSTQERSEPMSVWHAIYKRELIEKHNIRFMSEREILSEDIIFDINIIPNCKKIRFIPQALYHYCYNENSLTQNFQRNKLSRSSSLLKEMLSALKKQGLSHLENRVFKFFIGYNRGFLKQIIFSQYKFKEKKDLCYELYNNMDWKLIFQKIPISQIPIKQRLILYIIKYKFFCPFIK